MNFLKIFMIEGELTIYDINNTDFFLSEKKSLKEYKAKIILHCLKKKQK